MEERISFVTHQGKKIMVVDFSDCESKQILILLEAVKQAVSSHAPGSLLTLGAGFAFGVGLGTVAVSIGSTLGASAAFLAGRTLARGFIEAKISHNPRFRAIDPTSSVLPWLAWTLFPRSI